jgi:uncharacterized protein YutE (UPF0331/DUF86 family)/predicted nucleotidyltransferase
MYPALLAAAGGGEVRFVAFFLLWYHDGMADEDKKRDKLKDYFQNRDDVVMAFLFGSRAKEKGFTHAHSDWDIAVYFRPEVAPVEWEEHGREYPEEDRIWGDCIDMLETDDVDLVVLNRVPSSIANTAINGLPLIIKDKKLWVEFMLVVSREAEDFRAFSRDYYDIFQRSRSLTKDDAQRLGNIITFIEQQTDLYPYYRKFTAADYTDEPHKRNDVERWVENIMNASVDIAKLVLASQRKAAKQAYREVIASGAFSLGFGEDMAAKFEKWVRLRNVLAHEYLDIKWKRISNFIDESELYVRQFVDAAKKFLDENVDPKPDVA